MTHRDTEKGARDALAEYAGPTIAHDAVIYPDPEVSGVWAARDVDGGEYLITVDRDPNALIAPGVEEVEFTTWPPTRSR